MAIGFGIASRNWWKAQLKGGAIPSFILDFAKIATDFTFTRSSSATRVNEQGLIETVTSDIPRIDYSTGEGAFLLEPQSTNLITYSEDFKLNPAYSLSSTQVDSEVEISPSNSSNAYEVSVLTNNVNSVFDLGRVTTPNTTAIHTFSVYLKGKNEGDEVKLYGQRGTTFTKDVVLTTEWKRYDVTFTQDSADKDLLILCGDYGLTQPAQSFYIWGAQLEQLPYATSYIPTNGSAVTRSAESCVDGVVSANSLEGVLYWEGSSDVDSTLIIAELSQGNITNRLSLYYQFGIDARGSIRVSDVQTTLTGGGTLSTNKKIAVVWGNNVISFWVNGSQVDTDTYVGSIPEGVLTALNFSQVGGSLPFYGRTKDLKIYDKALTDDELITITSI